MRFLFDRCTGKQFAEWFRRRAQYFVEARGFGPDPGDTAPLEYAEMENRILITIDTDFGEFICGVFAMRELFVFPTPLRTNALR